ncbi:hypothetical protein BDA96_06G086100 [Sorghum bicolor]|uniref:Uncharacterized protein n=2 Tax=Sorghum bicolor TaxID=4558 RepID=A0A921UCR4_SORBI|nr:hypothetical protein BDA96_06G086100 [Sorghum bicolor]OQU81573.1 hypothetical protein SORBI_3006G078350 [Sorghum bicolor]
MWPASQKPSDNAFPTHSTSSVFTFHERKNRTPALHRSAAPPRPSPASPRRHRCHTPCCPALRSALFPLPPLRHPCPCPAPGYATKATWRRPCPVPRRPRQLTVVHASSSGAAVRALVWQRHQRHGRPPVRATMP